MIDKILNNICQHYNIDRANLTNGNRNHDVSKMKSEISFILTYFLELEKEVAEILNCKPSRIYHYNVKVQDDFDIDENYRKFLISML